MDLCTCSTLLVYADKAKPNHQLLLQVQDDTVIPVLPASPIPPIFEHAHETRQQEEQALTNIVNDPTTARESVEQFCQYALRSSVKAASQTPKCEDSLGSYGTKTRMPGW